MSTVTTKLDVQRRFSSNILLWMRRDQPRQTGMDHWKGPHSKIISASKGSDEYRQIHLADSNPGLWPAIPGVETRIPTDRKIDGIAEVTFQSPLALLQGRPQTKLAFKDEINVFRRTLLYIGSLRGSRRYGVAEPGATIGSRAVVYLRRRPGVRTSDFRRLVTDLGPALAGTGLLRELRTQSFLPWSKALWDTPNVAHDNPVDQQFHGWLTLGFADAQARASFFAHPEIEALSAVLAPLVSAIHAYDVAVTLTYVESGRILPQARP